MAPWPSSASAARATAGWSGTRGRDEQEPGPGQRRGLGVGQALPGGAVAPGVDGRRLPVVAPPAGQDGQRGPQRVGRVLLLQPERAGESGEVLVLDGVPHPRLARVAAGPRRLVGRLQPVALPLEGVRGQFDGARAGEPGGPVDLRSGGVRLPEGEGDLPRPAFVAAECGYGDGVGAGLFEGLLHADGEYGVGAGFDEEAVSVVEECVYGVGEAYGPPQVGEPVVRVEFGRVDPAAGDGGVERDVRTCGSDPGEGLGEFVADLLDLRAVGGVVHLDHPGPQVGGLRRADHGVHLAGRPGDHGRRGPVDGGHAHGGVPDQLQRALFVHAERGHRPTTRQPPQRPAPQRHDLRRILKRKRTRHTRGRDLPLTVPHHRNGLDTVISPHRRKRDHHRPQHRLHHIDPAHLTAAQHLRQRPDHIRRQRPLTLRDPRRENRRGIQQLRTHPRPLRTLTRKHQHRAGPAAGGPAGVHDAGVCLARREGRQRGQQFVPVLADDHGPVVEGRTRGDQRPADVGGRAAGGTRGERRRLTAQALGVARGQHPWQDAGFRGASFGRCLRLRHLLQDDVGIGAGHAERGHPGSARVVAPRPVHRLGQQTYRAGVPLHVRGRLVDVQGGGQHAVPEGHHHLDHPGRAGRDLRVPDVGLDRAQPQRPVFGPVTPVRRQQSLRLDRITQRGPRAVRLDRIHLTCRQPRTRQRRADHPLLRRTVRRGQTVARTVLVHRRTADEGERAVAVAPRVRQFLQEQDPDALGQCHAVAAGGERLGPAVRCQRLQLAEADQRRR